MPALSQEYNTSASGLRERLRTEGVSLRGHKITACDATQEVELYERGLSIEQVAKRVGYACGTIRRALLTNDVTIRTKP